MRQYIEQAIAEALPVLEKQLSEKLTGQKYISVEGTPPSDLFEFMAINSIPETAEFTIYNDNVCLVYDYLRDRTPAEKLAFSKHRFTDIMWARLYPLLTNNGYKRVGFNSGLLYQFNDTTVYDMVMAKDYTRLMAYYSLPFTLSP